MPETLVKELTAQVESSKNSKDLCKVTNKLFISFASGEITNEQFVLMIAKLSAQADSISRNAATKARTGTSEPIKEVDNDEAAYASVLAIELRRFVVQIAMAR